MLQTLGYFLAALLRASPCPPAAFCFSSSPLFLSFFLLPQLCCMWRKVVASSLEDVPWVMCVHVRCLGWGHGTPSTAPSRTVRGRENELCKRLRWLHQVSFLSFISRLQFHCFGGQTIALGSLMSICCVTELQVSRGAPQSPSMT